MGHLNIWGCLGTQGHPNIQGESKHMGMSIHIFERSRGYMNIGGMWMPPKSDNPP